MSSTSSTTATSRRPQPTIRCWRCSAARPPRAAPPRSTPAGGASRVAKRPRSGCSRPPERSASTSPPGAESAAGSKLYRFDPTLRLMSTVDAREDGTLTVHAKGAPEEVLRRSTTHRRRRQPPAARARPTVARCWPCSSGTRRRGCACSRSPGGACRTAPSPRPGARTPRPSSACSAWSRSSTRRAPEVADAVARCHAAGIRIIVVTGDYGLTAAEIARRVGIARDGSQVVTGAELDAMSERELDELLREGES